MQTGDAWHTIVLLLLEEPLKSDQRLDSGQKWTLLRLISGLKWQRCKDLGVGGRLGEGTKTKTPAGQIG